MATQITATLPTLDFPREVDYPTQEDWAAFSAAAELNFGILGGSWSTQMQNWKDQANAMSIELNTNSTIAQGLANYQGDWTSKSYTLGQTVSVSGVYYICKLTHATGQNPTTGGSIYWNLAIGNWNLKVNNYGNEKIDGIKTFLLSPIVPTPTTTGNVITMDNIIQKTAVGIGYGKGSGSSVSQLTNKNTNVSCPTPTGAIITSGSALSAGAIAQFTVFCPLATEHDTIQINCKYATGIGIFYDVNAVSSNGDFLVQLKNKDTVTRTENVYITYTILKGNLV